MSQKTKKWLKFAVRWGIAIGGITWVLLNISFNDRVMILDSLTQRPKYVRVYDAEESQPVFHGDPRVVSEPISRDKLWVRPDRRYVQLITPTGKKSVRLLAVKPAADGKSIVNLLIEDSDTKHGVIVSPSLVVNEASVHISSPLVEVGLFRMVREADPWFLIAAVLIIPISFLLTSLRWYVLLRGLDIFLSPARTFALNMVGAFYNTFMPGSTGGDLIKAWYASKNTVHRTRAVLSVLIDRVIGLLALVLLGGSMAAYQYNRIPDCRRVTHISALLIGLVAFGLIVFYVPVLRRWTGLDFLLRRLPMQRQVTKAVDAMELYGRRPLYPLAALCLSFPVHITTILSATMAGWAFQLPLSKFYYWVVVPVIALVGAIPISPQGAGVMEFFAVELTRRQRVTISQAFALTMSIRLVQIFWNLAAGVFVLRGGYHAPTEKEQEALETDITSAPVAVPET